MCLISIIIPIFNTEKVLNRCLDSVLRQTYTDWECLLIDDGSTDGSGVICDEYAKTDTRFRVFHQQNRGVSAARNVGLDNARGEWITFIDSDDWVEENLLKDYTDNWEGVDFVRQEAIFHNYPLKGDIYVKSVYLTDCLFYQDKILKLYKNNMLGFIWIVAVKRNIIEKQKLRFCEDYVWSEDWHFILRYAQLVTSFIQVPSKNYHYYFPPNDGTRLYRSFPIHRIKVKYEINELLRSILGEYLVSKIDIATPLYFEVHRMYYWSGIGRNVRIKTLKKYMYDNYIPYRGNRVRLIILHWCVKMLPPSCTDSIMRLLCKI